MPQRPLLDNPRSDRVRRVAALAGRPARRRSGQFLAEGPQAAREAVRFGEVVDLYVDQAGTHIPIADEALAAGQYVHFATRQVVDAMSPDAQGIVAVVRQRPAGQAELVDAGFVIMCAHVRDPGNAGTIIRIADAAGADAVVLAGDSVDVFNPKVVRASAGSLFHLPVITGIGVEEAIFAVKEQGCRVLATSGTGSVSLTDVKPDRPVAWLFGNEARGLAESDVAQADEVVSIPIFGQAESLNIAAAVALCAYRTALGVA